MRRRNYEWDPRPPNRRERLIAGLWLSCFILVQASYHSGWRLFGGYDKQVALGWMFVGLVLLTRFPRAKRVGR